MSALGVLNQQGNRLLFPVQQQQNAQQTQQSQQQQQQTQQQQPNVVGLPGPSPTTSNPGLSPFGNPLSQGSTTTTSTNSQFPATSNGPVSLPQVSPAGQSQNSQFNDMIKSNLMSSSFVQQQQQQQQQQQNAMTQQQTNQQSVTQNNTPRIPSSGADTITAQLPTSTGPKSASSSRGPSPAPATPIQSSPAAVTAASMGEYYKALIIASSQYYNWIS